MAFKTVYTGSFCNKQGGNVVVEFQRNFVGDFEVLPIEIKFAGENDEPVIIEYSEEGVNKDTPINKSQCTINIKAVDGFELSSLYTENDKDWKIIISGAWNWIGWMLPDNSSEPYEDEGYNVSVQATDALGTLDDVPFQNADLTKIKGSYSDAEILRLALAKTGLLLPMLIGVSTYETKMTIGNCPMKQSFIQAQTFIAADQTSFSCTEVIRSILARYGCRLFQFNGKWQVVNVLEYSRGLVYAWEFDNTGAQVATYTNIVNSIATGDFTRSIRPVNATGSLAKAYGSTTAYYQFGYPPNSLINGNMDTWSTKPTGLPDGWEIVQNIGTISASTKIRQSSGVDTDDYYISLLGSGQGYVRNVNQVQIRANQITGISMDLNVPANSSQPIISGPIYFSVVISDDAGHFYGNNGWQTGYTSYVTRYDSPSDVSKNQATVSFNLSAQNVDFKINVGFLVAGLANGTHYETYVNNVNVSQNTDGAAKPPIGSYNKQSQLANQMYQADSVLILNSDDDSTQRTSPILVTGLPTTAWKRQGITESVSLLHTIANTQLRLHSKPYKVFEGDFKGQGVLNVNSLITIDLNPGNFIFMSGKFNLRTDVHTLRFAQVLIDEPAYVETQRLDYGDAKNNDGVSVGTPQGVSDQPGGSYVDLTGYAKTADVPVAASNVETQAGTVANKYVSTSTLANWWAYIKTTAQTISGNWSFIGVAAFGSTEKVSITGTASVSALAFNRNAANGAIYNSANNAYQILHDASGNLSVTLFNSAGASIGVPLTISNTGILSSPFTPVSANDLVRKADLDSLNPNYRDVSANYTILNTDNTINVTANTVTLTLPTAVGIAGRIIRIKNSGTGTVTVNTTLSQLIDGTLTKVINTQYSLFGLQSTGTKWIIIAIL